MSGTNFWIEIQASGPGGTALMSAPAGPFGTTPPLPPSAVVGLAQAAVTPNPTTTSIQLSWSQPLTGNGLYTYNFAVSVGGASSPLVPVSSAPVTGIVPTTYTQTGLLPSSLYAFQVQAVDSLGQSGPWAITGLWTTAATDTPGASESAPVTGLTASGATITNAIGETYAISGGTGGASAPGPVSNITAGSITSTSITLQWNPPTTGSPVTSYQIAQATSAGGPFQNVGNPTTPSFTAQVAAATTYYFQITPVAQGVSGPALVSPGFTTSSSTGGAPGSVTPQRAGDFFNMLCIQCSMSSNANFRTTSVVTDIASMGARHFRDGPVPSPSYSNVLQAFANAGITMMMGTPLSGGANPIAVTSGTNAMIPFINQYNSSYGAGFVYAVESVNEPGNFPTQYNGVTGGQNDGTAVAAYTRDLYAAVKANFPNLPCFSVSEPGGITNNVGLQFLTIPTPAPSGVSFPAGTQFGTHLNEHFYPFELEWFSPSLTGGANVGTTQSIDPVAGDQFQNHESVDYLHTWITGIVGYANISQVIALPRAITEFGYRTNNPSANGDDVDTATQGKCMLTGILNAWLKGYFLFSIYELGYSAGGYGIFNGPNNPKPAGQYLRNFAAIVNDTSSTNRTFAPTPLSLSMTGLPAAPLGSYLLLQGSNGVYRLILWKNATNFNKATGASIAVAASAVTANLGSAFNIAVYDPTGGASAISTSTGNSVVVNVKDYPMIATLTPVTQTQPTGLAIKAQTVAASGISNPLGLAWNSGCLSSCTETNGLPTAGLHASRYGYTEICCQVPKGGPTSGPGFWPACVRYPLSGPGEIDIFEILGGSTTTVRQSIHNGQGTSREYDYTLPGGGDMAVGLHRVGCDWQSDTIKFYVDGVLTAQQATTSDMQQGNWYINLPLSVGGPSSWPGAPSPTSASSSGTWIINYVGVWASHAAAYPSGDSATATPAQGAALFIDNFTSLDISWSGSSSQWMSHFPFGGSEYTLSSTGEIEYFCDIGTGHVSSTGYQPFSLISGGVLPSTGTRKWYQVVGGDRSLMTTPFQTTASWITSGTLITQLRSLTNAQILTQGQGNWSPPLWVSTSTSDVLCTMHDSTGTIADFKMHVPAGAYSEDSPGGAGDNACGFIDTSIPYMLVTMNDCQIGTNASNTSRTNFVSATNNFIQCGIGMLVSDATGPIMMDAVTGATTSSIYQTSDNVSGKITYYDLQQINASSSYIIQHSVALTLGRNTFNNTGVWPFVIFDVNGAGSIPEGVMVGIPASTTRPTGQTRGFYALFDMFQQFGGIFNNVTDNGEMNIAVQNQGSDVASLVADLQNSFGSIVQYLCILNYTSGTAGAQYSVSTLKGRLASASAWSDAFPAPPTLDFSPTNNAPITPSTFAGPNGTGTAAWQASNGRGQIYNTIWRNG